MADVAIGSEVLAKQAPKAAQPAKTDTLDATIRKLRDSAVQPPDSIKEGTFVPAVVHEHGMRERAADALKGLRIGRREKPVVPPQPIQESSLETRAVKDEVSGVTTTVLKPLIEMGSGNVAERLRQGPGVITTEASEEDQARQARIAAAIQRGSEIADVRVAAQQKGQDPDAAEVAVQPATTTEDALEQLRKTTISDNPQSPSTDA